MSILSTTDGEAVPSATIEVGEELANDFEETHTVLHVMSQERFDERWEASMGRSSTYVGQLRLDNPVRGRGSTGTGSGFGDGKVYTADEHGIPDAERVARAVARETLGDGAAVTVRGRIGPIAEEIIAEANKINARYTVIGGRKRSAVGKAVFGSNTQSVLLNSSRPVVTVPPASAPRSREGPIVAAVDRTDRAVRVVAEAANLASTTGRDLLLVHAIPEGDDGEAEEEAAAIAANSADTLDRDVDFEAVGLAGDPGARMIEFAEERDASFIVVGGRKRSPVGKVLFGSVTQSIILNANGPVVAVMTDS